MINLSQTLHLIPVILTDAAFELNFNSLQETLMKIEISTILLEEVKKY